MALWLGIFLIATLLVLAWIDLRTFLLPDPITIPLIILGVVANALGWIHWASMFDSVLGAFLGGGFLYGLNAIYRRIKGVNGIGMGDAKLLAALGAFFGWEVLPYLLLIASLTGLLGGYLWLKVHHQDHSSAFPFGPYIALSGIITVIWFLQQPF